MDFVANLLGKEDIQTDPGVAVIRCSGSFENRPRTNHYDGASSCAVLSMNTVKYINFDKNLSKINNVL